MSPRSGVWVQEFGLDLMVEHITADDLEQNPEYGVGILTFAFCERRRRDGYPAGIDSFRGRCYRKLEYGWIFGELFYGKEARAPEVGKAGFAYIPGSPGRPVTPMRRAAIKALVRKLYLRKTWLEVTRRVCPCGDSHGDSNKVVAHCQPNLETQVRNLKRLLNDCDIHLAGELPAFAIMAPLKLSSREMYYLFLGLKLIGLPPLWQ